MAQLRVVIDNLFDADPSGVTRYTTEITRALIRTAENGDTVSGVIASHPQELTRRLESQFPGLDRLIRLPASSSQLALAWNMGIPPRLLSDGTTHSPTMLAPFFSHNRMIEPGVQTAVTLHSGAIWTAPETLSRRERMRIGRLLKLTERYADAIVVTHHELAHLVDQNTRMGDRVQVVPVSPTRHLVARGSVAGRARELGFPDRFLIAFASERPASLRLLLAAYAQAHLEEPLLLIGRQDPGQTPASRIIADSGLNADQVRLLGEVDDEALAVLNTRASALIYFGDGDALGLPLFDAMVARTPVIYPNAESLLEVTGGAGLSVPLEGSSLVNGMAAAMRTVMTDKEAVKRLAQEGADRARSFTWEDSARAIWALHRSLA